MWGCWCGGVVAARPATGERTAVLIKCSRVSEGASDLIVTQVLVTSICVLDAQGMRNRFSVSIIPRELKIS